MEGVCGRENLPISWLESKRRVRKRLGSHNPLQGQSPKTKEPPTWPYLLNALHLTRGKRIMP
jgi:hypothetical protein